MLQSIPLPRLIKDLKKIKQQGYIKTHRAHDTGVGKTLEDLLHLRENNFRVPDFGEIELKAKRIGSASMLTLATKSPEPKGVNRVLFENYKYRDKTGSYCLHSTVYGSRVNPQGLRMVLVGDKLVPQNRKKIEAYYPLSFFDDVLKSKSDKILLVFAEIKGKPRTKNERFHYVEAHLLWGLNKNKLASAIKNDKLKVDIRIGVYRSGKNKGKYHDHGTGFRINKRDFLHLFDNFKRLI